MKFIKKFLKIKFFTAAVVLLMNSAFSEGISTFTELEVLPGKIKVEVNNLESKDVICNAHYGVNLLDSLSGFSKKKVSFSLELKLIPKKTKRIFYFDFQGDNEEYAVEYLDTDKKLECEFLNDKKRVSLIRKYVLEGNIDNAIEQMKALKAKVKFQYIDLENSSYAGTEANIEELKRKLSITHVNTRNTPAEKRILQNAKDTSCRVMEHAICGVEFYRERTSYCGKPTYRLSQTRHCEVASYNSMPDEVCGPIYNIKENETLCGCDKRTSEFFDCTSGCSCTHPGSCRHPTFGIEKYATCEHKDFGVKAYKACRVEEHGVERYPECRKEQHGISRLKKCELKIVKKQYQLCGADETWDKLLNLDF